MVKSYTFEERNKFSKSGINIVIKYLLTLSDTLKVNNVEDEEIHQREDIDLIWIRKWGDVKFSTTIEVKTDKYTTSNFFFETKSNKELGTLGCFIKSKAEYIYYYFTEWDKLYILPLKIVIPWFLKNINIFQERDTTTKDEKGIHKHTTVGRLVPINVLIEEIKEIKVIENLSKNL